MILAIAGLTFSACTKKQSKVVVNLEDLRPIPTRQYEIDPDTVQIPPYKPQDLSKSFMPVFEQIFKENRFYPIEAEILPTRLGPSEYLSMVQKDDYEAQIATWYFLKFKDSVLTDNAWLNWLDCFGKNCQSLDVGSADAIDEKTGQIWTNDTLIVAYFSSREGGGPIKEAKQMDLFFSESLRNSLSWGQGKSGTWKKGPLPVKAIK